MSLLAVCVAGVGFSQSSLTDANASIKRVAKSKNEVSDVVAKKSNTAQEKGALLWSDDCSSAATWTFTNTSTLGIDWAVETNTSAIPVSALSPMASTTASNGFMFISSDANNSSDNDGTPIVAEFTNATAIDLTGKTYVSLVFEHNYRWWKDTRGVRVSGDNGATWTDFEITNSAGYPNLQNSGNPETTRIDISTVAGNKSQVFVQFYYNDNDIWAWYWAIDDVKIVENDQNDVTAVGELLADINNDFQYSQIPLQQARPLSFGLGVANIGIQDQTSVTATYDIKMGGSSVDAGVSSAISILSTVTDTIYHTTAYTPSALGVYTLDLSATISVDDDPSNNQLPTVDQIEVTDYIWAHDDGSLSRSYSQLYDADSVSEFRIGNQYIVGVDDTIRTIQIGMYATSTSNGVGQIIFGEVRRWNGSAWDLIGYTDEYELQAADLGTWLEFALNDGTAEGVAVLAGDQIAVVAGHYGGQTDADRPMFGGGGLSSEQQIGFMSDGSAWGFSGGAVPPAVRISFDKNAWIAAGIEENDGNIVVGQNYPNPFNGVTTINYTLNNADNVMVEITDLTGKVITVMNEGVKAAGNHVININSKGLAAGTYYYSIVTSNGRITKAMTVAK